MSRAPLPRDVYPCRIDAVGFAHHYACLGIAPRPEHMMHWCQAIPYAPSSDKSLEPPPETPRRCSRCCCLCEIPCSLPTRGDSSGADCTSTGLARQIDRPRSRPTGVLVGRNGSDIGSGERASPRPRHEGARSSRWRLPAGEYRRFREPPLSGAD